MSIKSSNLTNPVFFNSAWEEEGVEDGGINKYILDRKCHTQTQPQARANIVLCLTSFHLQHRKKIYSEDKTKVVAAVWGTELKIYSIPCSACLHQDDMKKRMNCTRMT